MANADDKAWRYGCMKTSVAQQLTYDDCQGIASLLGWPPAVTENIKNGLSLLRELEKKSLLSADDVEPLRKYLVQTEHHQAAAEVDKYREPIVEDCVDGQDNKQQQKPDYTKPHMKQEVTDSCLSLVAQKLGGAWKQFSIQKLKLTQAEIDICTYNNRDNLPDVIFDCLYKWKTNKSTLATFGLLAKLLFEFGCAREVWIVLESPE
ncbi:uncharacterized protein [Apostichopus japonicus]|uniref:uncharacterized protein n=1 Tax=Stichopus japonicus TaxID=307972 RepID=UPI003AB817EF